MVFVLPGVGVVVHSQDRMAKKKATMASSAMIAAGESWVKSTATPARRNMPRNSFGVMARWRFAAGSTLLKAWKRALANGYSWVDPLR